MPDQTMNAEEKRKLCLAECLGALRAISESNDAVSSTVALAALENVRRLSAGQESMSAPEMLRRVCRAARKQEK